MQLDDFFTWLNTSPVTFNIKRIEPIYLNTGVVVVYFSVRRLKWLDFRDWLFDAECGFVGRDKDASERRRDPDVVRLRNRRYMPRMEYHLVTLHFSVETNFYREPKSSEPKEVTVEELMDIYKKSPEPPSSPLQQARLYKMTIALVEAFRR